SEQNDDVPVRFPEGGRAHAAPLSRSDEGARSELEERFQLEAERRAREREERDGPPVAPDRSGTVLFTQTSGDELAIPAPWRTEPKWLREYGSTVVLVIDSQISSLQEFNTKRFNDELLKTRICQPLNVTFEFCRDCRFGGQLARAQGWFRPAE